MRSTAGLVVLLAAFACAPAAASPGRVDVTDRIKVDAGDSVRLFDNDDFKVTGTCEDSGGGDFRANTFLAAKRDNLLGFRSDNGAFDEDFDKGDPKLDITGQDASGTTEDYTGEDYNQDFYAEGKGGRVTQGRVATGVHLKGADCIFSGIFTGPADSGPVALVKRMKVDAGDGATIFRNKDFKVTGECEDNGGGDFTAETFLAARRNNLQFHASGPPSTVDPDFDASDPKVDISDETPTGTTADYRGHDYYREFWGEGKSGKPLDGRVAAGVHVRGADCTFSGIFQGLGGGGPLHPVKRMKADFGDKVTLFSNGNFKVTGECVDQGGADPLADTFLAARRNNLIYDLSSGGSQDLDFDAGEQIDLTLYDATTTDPFTAYDSYQEFYGEGKRGVVLEGRVATGVNLRGADCTFSGIFIG